LAALLVAVVVYGFQQTAVTPALPVVETDLHASREWTTWLLSGYFIVASVAPVFLGKLADGFGKRRVFIVALAVFAAGSVGAAAAPSIGVLVGFRVIQGVGGIVFPLSFSIVRDQLSGGRVGRGIGLLTSGFGIGSLAGYGVGGLLTQALSWRWIFIVGAVALGAAIILVRLTIAAGRPGSRQPLDSPGAALFGATVAAFILALTLGPGHGWAAPPVIGLFAAAAAAAAGWVIRELHTAWPLMDLRVLAARTVLVTNLVSMIAGYAVIGVNVLLSYLLVSHHGGALSLFGLAAGPLLTGVVLIPRALGQSAGGAVTHTLARRFGPAPAFALGMACIAAGAFGLTLWRDQIWQLLIELAGLGLGFGLAISLSGSLVTLAADPSQTSIATSINSVLRRLGGVTGTQVAAALLAAHTTRGGAPAPAAFTIGFAAAAGLAAVGVVAAILFIHIPPRPGRGKPQQPAHQGQ
jgi:MFS family permease